MCVKSNCFMSSCIYYTHKQSLSLNSQKKSAVLHKATVNGERFAGLNFCIFVVFKSTAKVFPWIFTLYKLCVVELFKCFKGTAKVFPWKLPSGGIRESLAQQIFPHLWYFSHIRECQQSKAYILYPQAVTFFKQSKKGTILHKAILATLENTSKAEAHCDNQNWFAGPRWFTHCCCLLL